MPSTNDAAIPYSTFLSSLAALPPSASYSFVNGATPLHLQASLIAFATTITLTVLDEPTWTTLASIERVSVGSAGGKGRSYQRVLLNALVATTEGIRMGRVTNAYDVQSHVAVFERFAVRRHCFFLSFRPPLFPLPTPRSLTFLPAVRGEASPC